MPYRIDWLSGAACVLIGAFISAEVAQANEELIRPGEKVVTTTEAAVKVGTRTLATVPPHTELTAKAVRGDWVAVTIQQDGKDISGWVHRKHLSSRRQATDQPAVREFRPQFNAEELERIVKKKKYVFRKPDDFPVMFSPLVLGIGGEVDFRQGRIEANRLLVKQNFLIVTTGEIADLLVIEPNGTQHYQKGDKELFRCELCSVVHFQGQLSEYRGQRVGIALPTNFLFFVCYDPRKPKDVFVSSRDQGGKSVLVPNCNVVRDDNTVLGKITLRLSAQSTQQFVLNVPQNAGSFTDLSGPCLKLVRKRKMLPGELNELLLRLKTDE